MGGYFRRWRRNAACFTLVIAMALAGASTRSYANRDQIISQSYRSVVLPLTLISAYFILWKPRQVTKRSPTAVHSD